MELLDQLNYAGFWRRFAAWFVDIVLLGIVKTVFLSAFGFDWSGWADGFVVHEGPAIYGGLGFTGLLTIAYFSLFESSEYQATPGKMLMGLKVVDYNGLRISFGKAFVRTISKYLSQLIMMLGYIMAAFTERKQALHDYIAATYVVDPGADDAENLASGYTV